MSKNVKNIKNNKGNKKKVSPEVVAALAAKAKEDEVMEVEMEQGDGDEDEDDEETKDFGPDFNSIYFDFLIQEKPEEFYEGEFELNRPFRASPNFLDNPHGAVKLFQGDSCALCAVYGPTEVRISKELPHRASVDVLFRPKVFGTTQANQITGWDSANEERALEIKITQILETVLFLEDDMGAGFNVIVHEFENDGSLFSTCLNAISLALLNAGCSMRCMFAAVTILVNEKDDLLVVDPSQSQIDKGYDALLTYVLSNDGNILYTGLEGKTTAKMMNLCMRQAKPACDEIFKFIKQVQLSECSTFFGKSSKSKVTNTKEVKEEKEVNVKLKGMKIENENDEDEYEDVEESDDVEDGEVTDDSSDSEV